MTVRHGGRNWPGLVRKFPVTWGKAVVFAGYSGFLHYLQLASHELATIGINVTKNQIPNSKSVNVPFHQVTRPRYIRQGGIK